MTDKVALSKALSEHIVLLSVSFRQCSPLSSCIKHQTQTALAIKKESLSYDSSIFCVTTELWHIYTKARCTEHICMLYTQSD
jgi:hypothetical protein